MTIKESDVSEGVEREVRLEYERRILAAECAGVRAEREMRERAAALCADLADQSADMAIYGEQEQARLRESMEAAATRLRHLVEQIPLTLGSEPDQRLATLSPPLPSPGVERLRGNPCDEIFSHKWLDPVCVDGGCQSLLIKQAVDVLKRLVVMARTSGGTAGADSGLMMVCDEAETFLVAHREAALSALPLDGGGCG